MNTGWGRMLRPRGMPGVNTGGGQYYYFYFLKINFAKANIAKGRWGPARPLLVPATVRGGGRGVHILHLLRRRSADTQNYLFETRKSTFVFSPFCFQTCFSYSNCLEFTEGSCSDCISGEADCIDQEDVGETHTLLAGIDSILKN